MVLQKSLGALCLGIVAIVLGIAATTQYSWIVLIALVVLVLLLAGARFLPRTNGIAFAHYFSDHPGVRLLPELVLFPLIVSIRQSPTVAAALLIGSIFFLLMRQRSRPTMLNLAPAAMIAVIVALVFRQDAYTFAVLFILAGVVLVLAAHTATRESAYASLIAGLALYLVANIIGWMAGLKSVSATVRVGGYDSSGSIFGDRVFFPFASSINEPAYLAAAFLLAVVGILRLARRPLWYHWVGVVAALVVILASNSRTPVLIAVPVAILLLLLPKFTRSVAPYAVTAALLLPFILAQMAPVVQWVAQRIASNSYLARGQTVEQIVGLGTREIIWSESIQFWNRSVTSTFDQLFGFGYNGHAKSGASIYYIDGIGDFLASPTALTMHNSLLQTLFDAGLVGAGCLVVTVVYVTYRYSRQAEMLPMLAVALLLGLSAAAEVSLAPGMSQTSVFLFLYLAVFVPIKGSVPRKSALTKQSPKRQAQSMAGPSARPLSR